MRQKAFNKEIRRSITHSLGRFIAIFAIVALGVGFYAGLQMTAPDMKLAADAFYDDTNLFDIRVVSTMGFSDENVEALSQVEGVEAVQADRETDAEGMLDGEPYTFRIHSVAGMLFEEGQPMPEGTANDEANDTANDAANDAANSTAQPDAVEPTINQLVVKEGRLPQAPGECVISADRIMSEPVQLGDTITLTQGATDLADVLRRTDFTVVGLVTSPYYTSTTEMGSTSVGSGTVEQFMYIRFCSGLSHQRGVRHRGGRAAAQQFIGGIRCGGSGGDGADRGHCRRSGTAAPGRLEGRRAGRT